MKYSLADKKLVRDIHSAHTNPPDSVTNPPKLPSTSADTIRVWIFSPLTLGFTSVLDTSASSRCEGPAGDQPPHPHVCYVFCLLKYDMRVIH